MWGQLTLEMEESRKILREHDRHNAFVQPGLLFAPSAYIPG